MLNLLDNCKVYVRFHPFVSGRVHPTHQRPSPIRYSVRNTNDAGPTPRLYIKEDTNLGPSSISDATI